MRGHRVGCLGERLRVFCAHSGPADAGLSETTAAGRDAAVLGALRRRVPVLSAQRVDPFSILFGALVLGTFVSWGVVAWKPTLSPWQPFAAMLVEMSYGWTIRADSIEEQSWLNKDGSVCWPAFRRFRGPGQFPIAAYSEFMPPPRLGRKPYGAEDPVLFQEDDPLGWHVTEYEEVMELRPGLEHLAAQLVHAMEHLGNGRPAHGIARAKLEGNPYWPDELAERAGRLPHERYVVIAPLALSRTQDDKGRVRWTLFGGSEQGPSRAFWKGFFTAPGREIAAEEGLGFFRRLLAAAYGESPDPNCSICSKAGFRILPGAGRSRLAPFRKTTNCRLGRSRIC